ncbi:MAG TPA: S-layer homology domain-containing protein, partial [Oscillospiraceae bacterium]|nr:S-layer homology domain-containing protein [Oscillospiraceae bacterium]
MKIKKTVAAFLALVMVLGSTAAIFAKDWSGQQSFSDVKKSHWAHGYVENLANQGIVSGYGKTDSFKPENPILRQEAAKMIAEAAGLKASAGFVSKFVDLGDAGEWALKYIYALEESGVINGFGATGEFRPKDFIQRGHIALMLVRAFNLKSGPLDVLISDLNLTGNDREARAAIEILASNGIVSGFGNTNKFHPLNDIDRAGFAKMVALAQAAAAVQKAEASGNPADIAGAKALIGNLPDNQDKETQKSLLDRLDETVPVKSVVVSPTTLALTVDQTGTVTATVAPGDATNKTVAWTTSNAAVATVAGGVVTAVSAGAATITATAGEKTATVAVTVKNIQQAAPAGLAAVPPTAAGGNDGKITGVTDAMEYKLSTA